MKKLKYIGYLITILSVVYVIWILLKLDVNFSELDLSFSSVFLLIGCLILCSITVFMFGFAWKLILEFIGGQKLPFRDLLSVYAKSNLGKYLPGNIMHFAARNILGNKLGWKHHQIIMSSILEIVLIMFTLSLVLFFTIREEFVDIVVQAFVNLQRKWILIVVLVTLLIILIIAIYIKRRHLSEYIVYIKKILTKDFLWLILKVSVIYLLVFAVLGSVLGSILYFVLNVEMTFGDLINVAIIYSLSWVAGFIIIGTPGGIGVRESVLILLMIPIFGESETMIAILLHRFVSILGETLAFFGGYLMGRRKNMVV